MSARSRTGERLDLALCALVAALVFLPGLGGHDVWNPDEPRYAQVAREMLESGQYLVPHYNGRLYTQKPPLMFWAMAAFGALRGGLDETAVRLPSALAAIGAVLLIYRLGRRLFDRPSALLAAAAFATSSKVLWQARTGQIDMLLLFLVLCAVSCWWQGRLEGRPGWSYLFFVFAGLATVAKGPVGLLPPLIGILVFLAVTRDRQGLSALRLGRGLLLWAGVVLLWLGPALLAGGGEYAQEILFKQNVTRYVTPWGHRKPPWYFLQVMPVDFLPWSLWVPAALVGAWRRLGEPERRHFLFLVCWVAATVVFFSLSPGKRTVYVLSCYPGLALLAGAGLAALASGRRPARGWLAAPAGLWAGLLWVIALALPRASRWVEVPAFAEPLLGPVAIGLGALAAVATAALVLALRARVAAMAAMLAAGMAAGGLALFLALAPRLDSELSLRPLAGRIASGLPPGHVLASWHEMEGGLLFYGSGYARELADAAALAELRASGQGFWLVVDPDDRGGLEWPLDLPVIDRQSPRGDGVLLFGSR